MLPSLHRLIFEISIQLLTVPTKIVGAWNKATTKNCREDRPNRCLVCSIDPPGAIRYLCNFCCQVLSRFCRPQLRPLIGFFFLAMTGSGDLWNFFPAAQFFFLWGGCLFELIIFWMSSPDFSRPYLSTIKLKALFQKLLVIGSRQRPFFLEKSLYFNGTKFDQ